MHSENNELVKAGHELAKYLDSNTPLMDIAKMIVRLADKLDVTTAALREKTKQCAAEHNDVLAWEKTMFKVCGEDGTKSVAEKFASLEASRAALAAENAALKDFIRSDCLVPDINGYDKDAADFMPETPATDAFLRKVRAEAILFASYHLPDGGKYQDSIQALAQEVLDWYTQVSFPVQQQRQGGAA
ncbi:hypothetical protein QMS74_01730 [Cronobacter sakazakii]|nr:hypothetical protein [Cronobacter sakazakii]